MSYVDESIKILDEYLSSLTDEERTLFFEKVLSGLRRANSRLRNKIYYERRKNKK